ncbi:hypothetical protein FRB90_012035 [Tulasnella sp. 427]|nr:hypothetical protein FRB90_012035 [Tulasnella sp. 427]
MGVLIRCGHVNVAQRICLNTGGSNTFHFLADLSTSTIISETRKQSFSKELVHVAVFPKKEHTDGSGIWGDANDLTEHVSAESTDTNTVRKLLFSYDLKDAASLMSSNKAGIRLLTFSKDQGWVRNPEEGSWSWFEIGITAKKPTEPGPQPAAARAAVQLPPNDPPLSSAGASGSDSDSLFVWQSHRNPLAGKDYSWLQGNIFGPKHEIWKQLQKNKGHHMGVWMCAKHADWKCKVKAAELQIIHIAAVD